MTDITVITATIPGREKFMEECRAAVEAQTLQPFEHLVYMDEEQKGIQHSMNELWPRVTTDWMQWVADDDILLPQHLEKVRALAGPADIVHAYCSVWGRPGFLPNYRAEHSNYNMTATALMRTEMVRALDGWHPTAYPEDLVFWLKARDHGYKFDVVEEVTWIYRFHGANLSWNPVPKP